MTNAQAIFRVALIASLAIAAACGEEEDEAAPTVTKKDPTDKPPEEVPLPASKPADLSYTYNAVGRRDPFMSYFEEIRPADTQVDEANLTPLQKIEIDRLKLIAVVVGTATPMAMVEDPDGKGHTLKIGTLVGKRLGQVKSIRRGEVIIQEEFRDFTGKRIPQTKELKLTDEKRPQ